ncbi:reverse transcriptase [Gossypium australe]|uniref:Reverse transcriptase n=1 Tax=Gossypium australe TaxID=47621 RepID=A0A5B6V9Y8_9ROSI|nr:reverse transcriptase [Gossypium australe]
MNCVRTVRYIVKCNNTLSDVIIPERGLRQGYLLSPYLFLFCVEALSRMLLHVQDNNVLRGIRASINGLRINHLFLQTMPLFLINSWTKRLLSFGGKEIFIQAILWSLPTYAMSIFLAPKGVVKYMQTNISRVWWSGKDRGRFWTMISWKKLCHLKANTLKDGFGWQVGYGDRINIRTDNWGLEGLNGEAIKSNLLNHNEYSVRELWHVENRSWNTCRVRELYGQDLGEKICNLPIGDENHNDRMVWFHNSLREYTLKSAYSWLLLKQIGFGPHRFFWRAIWKLDTLPNICVFTWRVGNEILPTNIKIASIHRGFGQACPRCGTEYETLVHSLKDCPSSRATLMFSGLDSSIISKEYDRCIDWLEDMLRILDKKSNGGFYDHPVELLEQ